MRKIYFTADWHLGDERIGVNGKPNLFYRPFRSVDDQHLAIIKGIQESGFQDGDTLYHLGDVMVVDDMRCDNVLLYIQKLFPNSDFTLIRGNYDTDDRVNRMKWFFNDIREDITLDCFSSGFAYLNHYPIKCLEGMQDARIGITGHIHGLWKVQKHLINVGVDAWHFQPVSEDTIQFCWDAMDKHYDTNVFPYTERHVSL